MKLPADDATNQAVNYAAEPNVTTAAHIAAAQRPRVKSTTTIKDLNLTSRR
jgi:hypothetical protein